MSSALGAFLAFTLLVLLQNASCKYRLCVVDGVGGFNNSRRYCPVLEGQESKVECVLGLDRLDCLRKIWNDAADFGVFQPEDMIAAMNTNHEVLVTSELRYDTNDSFEDQLVVVVDDRSNIKSKHDLKGKKFCHPGFAAALAWKSRILANFLEASTVYQTCNPQLTLAENRISASSKFFKKACKAGPWVHDAELDRTLKSKYRNLCDLCDSPRSCSRDDKYWGAAGALLCLTDGVGEVSWARLEDVKFHFNLVPGGPTMSPDGYSYLCPDETMKPVNSSNPCIWTVKPWPIVAASRTAATDVQSIVSTISHDHRTSWQSALLNLMETYHSPIKTLDEVQSVESYLNKAVGFLSAYSFSGCHPPRTVRICTTSAVENAKCGWMMEAAAVQGIEPDVDCVKADNTTHCMRALVMDAADVVMVPPDLVREAKSKYNLKTLLYETVNDDDKYLTVMVVKKGSKLKSLGDLKGAKACFPTYDGIAWNSMVSTLSREQLISKCPYNDGMADFFGPSCVPNAPLAYEENLGKLCQSHRFYGDMGALTCLNEGVGDVAFVSNSSIRKFIQDHNLNAEKLTTSDFTIICETKPCHLSWSPIAQAMILSNTSSMRFQEMSETFSQLDHVFGKNSKELSRTFSLFGPYNGISNLLFHDETLELSSGPFANRFDTMPRLYENVLEKIGPCQATTSGGDVITPSVVLICLLAVARVWC